ncbi:NAD(P)/FAD-dependent oxidoreductase [Falsarthrobacter nasiphocae]|uniref:NADH dehydrogenase n=1 Tax=Falsarthrobacter nasiphocae TaxID=189863 RepID=A0AAE4C614_9MICC|nr:FAD-dependent oxidoreductase [Falsarthrobacter nasiphocae]MDR6891652.1 NADH dehydrogenase [Falsarthrobacter nasiphocae]
MAEQLVLSQKPRILVVGGGYAGLYVAKNLQAAAEAHGDIVTVLDPLPYMTYQPFLPEVASGSIEPRHAIVSHRQHLTKSELLQGSLTAVDHSRKVATAEIDGESVEIPYKQIVMTAGAITRTFPIPGLAETGIGMKAIEEAVGVRDGILDRIEAASTEQDPARRERLLTFVVVGGGFAGIETISEIEDMARAAVAKNPRVKREDLRFVLVEAMGRIMPEVAADQAEWVVEHLRSRGIEVLLNTSLADATDGRLQLISMPDKAPVQTFESDMLIWTAGVMANPVVRQTDFPVEERGRLQANAKLQIEGPDGVVADAWTAGDVAAVPDLSGGGVGGMCVPNAQHAVRQAKLLAKNLKAHMYGEGEVKEYHHVNLGAVAGFGLGKGVARIAVPKYGDVKLRGPIAWLAHRGYHGMAMPMFERKARVFGDWIAGGIFGRDITPIPDLDQPRALFERSANPKK